MSTKADADKDARNFLTTPIPSTGLLSIPRAPGESGQTSRSRKCSIVQEEDDEEELSSCSGRDDHNAPLNRRGSRSEGRLNVAVQDRVAETERLKAKDSMAKVIDGISGVKIISKDTNNTIERLGARGGLGHPHHHHPHHKSIMKTPKFLDPTPSTAAAFTTSIVQEKHTPVRNVVGKETPPEKKLFITAMKVSPRPSSAGLLKPIGFSGGSGDSSLLNEIAEEGSDGGRASSVTPPPPATNVPNARETFFAHNQGPAAAETISVVPPNKMASTARRAQFNKARTASCSSSDASDDDSENRKKRAHKIVDVGKPIQQRRDSHDDSSDSQDPGNSTATGNKGGSSHILEVTATKTTTTTSDSSQQKSTQDNHKSAGGGRQNNLQQICGYRKHRSGRRLAGETRLRESQSLNRITEVHECDQTTFSTMQQQQAATNKQGGAATIATTTFTSTTTNTTTAITTRAATSTVVAEEKQQQQQTSTTNNKSKFLGVRLLQGFRKHNIYLGSVDKQRPPTLSDTLDDYNVEIMLSEELTKALRVPEKPTTNKNQTDHITSSSSTKKLKILGKYFQVCIFSNFCFNSISIIIFFYVMISVFTIRFIKKCAFRYREYFYAVDYTRHSHAVRLSKIK